VVRILDKKPVLAERGSSFANFRVRESQRLQTARALEQLNQRKQYRVLSVLRTPTFPPGMWFIGYASFSTCTKRIFCQCPLHGPRARPARAHL